MSHPTPENLIIVPTHRSPTDGLALSSRNAYLTDTERKYAGTLFEALKAGKEAWEEGEGSRASVVAHATRIIQTRTDDAARDGVEMKLDYIEVNDPETLDVVDWPRKDHTRAVIVSGALMIGRTRLIDNLLCGDSSDIISS